MKQLTAHRVSSGFSLVEVMATMLVSSVGLLGILGVYIKSIQATDAAYLHSQAVVLAYDLSDRIRANPSAVTSYELEAATTLTSPASDCLSSICGTTELAAADLYDWKTRVETVLPSGDAVVDIDGSDTTITLSWVYGGENESFIMEMN